MNSPLETADYQIASMFSGPEPSEEWIDELRAYYRAEAMQAFSRAKHAMMGVEWLLP